MPLDFISLRKSVTGAVVDLLDTEQMACVPTQDGLVTIIDALAAYREEGRSLFPEIFVIDDLPRVLKLLPGHSHVSIGTGPRAPSTMAKALKQCAPLARDGWAVCILRKPNAFSYGVFRSGVHALSVSIADILVINGDGMIPVLLVRQLSENLVEVQGVNKSSLLVHFGTTREADGSPVQALNNLVSEIVRKVEPGIQEQAQSFFKRVLLRAMNNGHGTLVAVASANLKKLPRGLRDGIELSPRIDIARDINSLLKAPECLSHTQLKASETLIEGMVASDGITVFGPDATVRAFNVFVKHPMQKLPEGAKFGGARRRTFDVLATKVGTELTCAFMLSQDGGVAIKRI